MTVLIDPPFGAYALPAKREAWRKKADRFKGHQFGRWQRSYVRKKALAGEIGPFDVEFQPGIRARLYPRDNLTEKRVFAGSHNWDVRERSTLKLHIAATQGRPFVFLDVGANVGIYSLFVDAYAKELGHDVNIIAFEPSEKMLGRLRTNLAINNAEVTIMQLAISDEAGTGFLGGGDVNHGEATLGAEHAAAQEVTVETLPNVVTQLGLTQIDAIKIDIEGHDLPALTKFFAEAPEGLHPKLLIVETGILSNAAIVELCLAQGYTQTANTALNGIFEKSL